VADRPMQVTTQPGAALAVHTTAAGKALLAGLPEAALAELAGGKLERLTARTITDWEKLRSELDAVTQDGFAYDREETAEGVCAIAIAVHDVLGAAYSISITIPAPRFEASIETCRHHLLLCQQQVEASAGVSREHCVTRTGQSG